MKRTDLERPREQVARLLRAVRDQGDAPQTVRVGVLADQLLHKDVHPLYKFRGPSFSANGSPGTGAQFMGLQYIVDPAVDRGAVFVECDERGRGQRDT